ncbi:DUF3431 domain-containing protein [uncultured Arcobacter sp.]|uniref:DUF3431 domain-containing protein n=1 Tax=uncultured Arcobacter sp. TaxID=165434 RepID=UPI002615C38A|nr:DUF3431 domain-containing protein [uncultured Arcobacter sp.]
MTLTKEIVIAKYNEDISWIDGVDGYKITIYDKSKDIPNIGRESHTFLYHICLNYHNLSDLTIFTQGNPFDHCEMFIKKIKEINIKDNYTPLSDNMLLVKSGANTMYKDPKPIKKYQDLFELPNVKVSFPYGAIMAVKKEGILNRPLSYYLKLLTYVSFSDEYTHSLEYLWGQIFK